MGFNVELQGDGARALRAFITQQQQCTKDELSVLGDGSAALTTVQLRHAASLLQRLRCKDPTTPVISSFLKQDSGVRVQAVPDQNEDHLVAASKEHIAYMARRRKKLLRLDEEMRYGRLVSNVKGKSSAVELENYQKSARQHLSIGANMIAARVTAFVAMYILARTLTDNETTVRVCPVVKYIFRMRLLTINYLFYVHVENYCWPVRRDRHDGDRDGAIYHARVQVRVHRARAEATGAEHFLDAKCTFRWRNKSCCFWQP